MPSQSSHNIAFLPLKPYFPSHPTCSIKNRKREGKRESRKRRVALISTFSCSYSYPPGKPKKDHLAHEIVIDRSFFLRQIVLSQCLFYGYSHASLSG
ncbi:hypothetical protein CEXT_597501 [Caerostris extrusa]|uniref:Ycf15 n=1 Tax=Caerostris extrusa TaxID=172846 RepID=A0AAV4WI60_CAEEX|nr:hypothetical protein CEXT_597501 [Caerostris extrusa]